MKLQDLIEGLEKLDLSKFDNTHLKGGTVLYAQKFVEQQIQFLKENKGNEAFLPYYNRLLEFYQKITT